MTVSRDVKDGIADTGIALIRREGVLGFAAIVAALMLGAFMWQGWKQTDLIVDVLQTSQQLQARTLKDNKERDAILSRHADALEKLSRRSRTAAENLDRLVAIFLVQTENSAAWQSGDAQRTKAVLERLDEVARATGLSAEELKKLREKVRKTED